MPLVNTSLETRQLIGSLTGNINAPNAAEVFDQAFRNRVFVKPTGVGQIGAFTFDLTGDESVQLDNDITDHWLESNEAAVDHIAIKPVIVSIRGQIAELSLSGELLETLNTIFATVQNGLSQAPAYLGRYTPGVTDALSIAITRVQSMALQIQTGLARAQQIQRYYNQLRGKSTTKQQAAYNNLASLRDARMLFTVYTPFQVFHNMAIQSLRFNQPASTRTITDVTCTMKQLQFASQVSTAAYQSLYGGNLAQNGQPNVNSGSTGGSDVGASVSETSVQAFRATRD